MQVEWENVGAGPARLDSGKESAPPQRLDTPILRGVILNDTDHVYRICARRKERSMT